MRDAVAVFREYAHLDLRRIDQGLSVKELERWQLLKHALESEFGRPRAHGSDRRSSKRVVTRLNCSYASSHELRDAVITDLATGGVFIQTLCPLPVGSELKLRIRMKNSNSEIEVDGVVVSNNVGPHFEAGVRGMGVRFARVGVDVVEQISVLYAEELRREVAGTVQSQESARP
jgi:uncharacterized protein (TIGR02266 family)